MDAQRLDIEPLGLLRVSAGHRRVGALVEGLGVKVFPVAEKQRGAEEAEAGHQKNGQRSVDEKISQLGSSWRRPAAFRGRGGLHVRLFLSSGGFVCGGRGSYNSARASQQQREQRRDGGHSQREVDGGVQQDARHAEQTTEGQPARLRVVHPPRLANRVEQQVKPAAEQKQGCRQAQLDQQLQILRVGVIDELERQVGFAAAEGEGEGAQAGACPQVACGGVERVEPDGHAEGVAPLGNQLAESFRQAAQPDGAG